MITTTGLQCTCVNGDIKLERIKQLYIVANYFTGPSDGRVFGWYVGDLN